VAAAAESLPFEDQSFDAAMAFATVHHWQDPIAGLREMRRVARRVVVFTHDASDAGWHHRFWLTRDNLPEVADLVAGRPSVDQLAGAIRARIEPVLIPWDCADGFFGVLAPTRGIPGPESASPGIGVGQGRDAGRAAGGAWPP
jgi:SAM-dependent methyltransferase